MVSSTVTTSNILHFRKGLAMGVVVGGFGGGALIFNYIQTAILNPDNLNPDLTGNSNIT